MNDYMIKVISESGSLRAYACVTTGVVNEAWSREKPAPLSGMMLGRALSGMALLGGMVKGQEKIWMKFEGNGPIQKIQAECTGVGAVRGSCLNGDVDFDPSVDLKTQIRASVGVGLLTVTKDLGMKEPYSGTVHMISGEIGEDIAFYLTESEQIPSAVAVAAIPSIDGSGVDVAGGWMIQSIPSHGGKAASDESNIESIMAMINSLPPLNKMLADGFTPEQIIAMIFTEIPHKIVETVPLEFKCNCSLKMMVQALKIAGNDEIQSLIDEENGTTVSCQFCKHEYHFSHDELKSIIDVD